MLANGPTNDPIDEVDAFTYLGSVVSRPILSRLVTLHWAHARAVRSRAVATFWPLRARRTVEVCGAWSGRPVEFKLSVWAHVFFSREGRMKVMKTSVRGSVMLPMGAASLSRVKGVPWFWKRRRTTVCWWNWAVIYQLVSWPFHLWYRRGCCDGGSSIELLWRQQLSGGGSHWSFVLSDGPSFLAGLVSDNGSDFCLIYLWLDSR